MAVEWEQKLTCAVECPRCKKALRPKDQRILSGYDNEAICMECKKKEETRTDYQETSETLIKQCLVDVELMQSDPGGYCAIISIPTPVNDRAGTDPGPVVTAREAYTVH